MAIKRYPLHLMMLITVSSYFNQVSGAAETHEDIYWTNGLLTARVIDTKECGSRKVQFLAYGAVLDEIEGKCDTPDRLIGLVLLDSVLRYYDRVAVLQETKEMFSIVKKTSTTEKEECTQTQYELHGTPGSSYNVKSKTVSPDKSCEKLKPLPPMKLLSSSRDVGSFEPAGEDWMIFNPWEPLGFVSREYKLESKCFRLVVVTSYGRVVHGVKLTCGPIAQVTTNGNSLYIGDILNANFDSPNKVTVLININALYCIKKTIAFEKKEGGSEGVLTGSERIRIKDLNCNRLARVITVKYQKHNYDDYVYKRLLFFETTIDIDVVGSLKTEAIEKEFPVTLKSYLPSGPKLDYNIAMDYGVLVQSFTNAEGEVTVITPVIEGSRIKPVILKPGAPSHVVVRKNALYCGKAVALTRLDDVTVQKTTVMGNGYCECTELDLKGYPVKNDDKKENCEDLFACVDFVEGTYLQTAIALKYGGLTDEIGVPLLLTVKAETNA